jgi:alpha-glucosidase
VKKFFKILGLIVIVGLLIWSGTELYRYFKNRPITGETKCLLNKELQTDNYRIVLSENHPQLCVIHIINNDTLLASAKDVPFLTAATGKETVEEHRGSFFVEDKLIETFIKAKITEAEKVSDKSIRIFGELSDKNESFTYGLIFSEDSLGNLQFSAKTGNKEINRLILSFSSHSSEHFSGLGEQFTHLQLKGHKLPVFISEQGIGRGKQPLTAGVNLVAKSGGNAYTSYASMPWFVSSENYGFLLHNYAYSDFDFRADDFVQIKLFAGEIRARIFSGDDISEILEKKTLISGRMKALPEWTTSGAIIGMQGGTEKVREIYGKLKKLNAPIAGFWLQDWVGQRRTSFGKQLWWNWQLDTAHYPGWHKLKNDLLQDSVYLLSYVNPFLADVSENPKHTRNLYREAEAAGYLVKDRSGATYLIPNTDFSAAMIDLTNPEAVRWFKQVMQEELTSTGVKGWMADFGEALPYDAVLHEGNPKRLHNKYPEMWAELNRTLIDSLEQSEEYTFFMRAAYTNSPKYAGLFWEGDQMVTWDKYDGLRSAVIGLQSSGISGMTINHSDIGGYTAITDFPFNYVRSKELFMRWAEFAAFTPVFRTHEGNRPEENFQFYDDDEATKHFVRCAKIYQAWNFYLQELSTETEQKGLPIVRPLFMHYPDDPECRKLSWQQYLLGTELLIAPVTKKNADTKKIYLPRGQWTDIWTQKVYDSKGEYIIKQFKSGEPPAFAKTGSETGEKIIRNLNKI